MRAVYTWPILWFRQGWLIVPPLLVCCGLLFVERARRGLWFPLFVDEAEHIVGGHALAAGDILYRDFVDAHGPLVYAFADAAVRLPGLPQPGWARLLMVFLMIGAGAAVVRSPCLRGAWEKACGAALFAGITATVWLVQGLHMLHYQPMAGMLLLIGCAQFTACRWSGVPPTRLGSIVAGASLALVPFAAYDYAPAALLLATSGMIGGAGSTAMRRATFGGAIALSVFGLWMLLHCDLVGFVVYHFIFNQLYFAKYIHFQLSDIPASLVPATNDFAIVQTMAVATALAGMLLLAWQGAAGHLRWRRLAALGVGVAAVAMSNPRGSTYFQNGAFVVLAIGLAALGLPALPRLLGVAQRSYARSVAALLYALCVVSAETAARAALGSPFSVQYKKEAAARPIVLQASTEQWAQRLRRVVAPDERIIALNFMPLIYLMAGRQPMQGYNSYFPWDADYARKPWFGRTHDICVSLQQAPPPALFYKPWIVWGQWSPAQYMSCITPILAANYQRVDGDSPLYIRKDRLGEWLHSASP